METYSVWNNFVNASLQIISRASNFGSYIVHSRVVNPLYIIADHLEKRENKCRQRNNSNNSLDGAGSNEGGAQDKKRYLILILLLRAMIIDYITLT